MAMPAPGIPFRNPNEKRSRKNQRILTEIEEDKRSIVEPKKLKQRKRKIECVTETYVNNHEPHKPPQPVVPGLSAIGAPVTTTPTLKSTQKMTPNSTQLAVSSSAMSSVISELAATTSLVPQKAKHKSKGSVDPLFTEFSVIKTPTTTTSKGTKSTNGNIPGQMKSCTPQVKKVAPIMQKIKKYMAPRK